MNLQFMIVIYTRFARQSSYIMNLRFMIVIYTHFVRQSSYIINLRFMIVIYNPSKAKLVNNLRSDCEEGLSGLQTLREPTPKFLRQVLSFQPRLTDHDLSGLWRPRLEG